MLLCILSLSLALFYFFVHSGSPAGVSIYFMKGQKCEMKQE